MNADEKNALFDAARRGDLSTLQRTCDRHGKIAFLAKDEDGWTPLWSAARNGHVTMVKYLLSRPQGVATISVQSNSGGTPVLTAAANGRAEIVELLLSSNGGVETIAIADKNGDTSLHRAAYWGYTDCATLLLQASPDLQKLMAVRNNAGETALHTAVEKDKGNMLKLLLACAEKDGLAQKNSKGQTALALAESRGNAAIRKCFEDAEAGTLLHSVAQQGELELFKHIITVKGKEALTLQDQQGRTPTDCKDAAGATVVHHAAAAGQTDLLKMLVSGAGSRVLANVNSKGDTALHEAAQRGAVQIFHSLVEMGGAEALTAVNHEGSTPLDCKDTAGATVVHHAVAAGHTGLLKAFVSGAGARVLANTDSKGMTALHHAAANLQLDIIQVLVGIPESAGFTSLDHKGLSAWDHMLEHCGRRPRGETAKILANLADRMVLACVQMGDVKTLESNKFTALVEHTKPRLPTLRGAAGETIAHMAASRNDPALLLWVLRHVKQEEQDEYLRAKTSNGKTALELAEQKGHKHIVQLLWGEGAGAGGADDAHSDPRKVIRIRWCTMPIRTLPLASHSFILATVNTESLDAEDTYIIEKCFVPGGTPIVVSYWSEDYMTSKIKSWGDLDAGKLTNAPTMEALLDIARGTGEYSGGSQCHHCALALFNAYAKAEHRRQEVREAIQDLWKELRWLESHKPADEDARATLDDCLEAAEAALDDQQLIYVRPEVAAEKVKNITVDIKSTMAKVQWMTTDAIYRLMLDEQQRAGAAQAKLEALERRARDAEAALADARDEIDRARAEATEARAAAAEARTEVAEARARTAERQSQQCCIIT